MINLLIWILVSYGISNIVVYGKIFQPFRNIIYSFREYKIGNFIYDMTDCMMCFSTWLGFFLGIFIYSPTYVYLDLSLYYSWFFDGMLSSGGVWIIHSIVEFFEENRISHKDEQQEN